MLRFFYKENDRIYFINENNDELHESNVRSIYQKKQEYHYYECFKGYDATHEGLIKFRDRFLQDCDQIKAVVDYQKYYFHTDAVYNTFLRFASRQIKQQNMSLINYIKSYYFEKTNNGGWIKLMDEFKGQTIQSYAYDQSGFYPWLLAKSDFKFPIREGARYYLDSLDYKNLDYGIYNVVITCEHPDFNKVFVYSKNYYYTHQDIKLAYKYRKKYSVNIQLNLDCKANCLLYEETDLINSSEIFQTWYERLYNVKRVYPDNKVIKHLMSSLWGHLIQFNRMFCNEDDFLDMDVSNISDYKKTEFKLLDMKKFNGISRYEYISSEKPYKTDFRIKSFFTSFARNFMIQLVLSEGLLDSLIRVHTDGIVLTKEHDFTHLPYHPKPEEKNTGLILWLNAMDRKKLS